MRPLGAVVDEVLAVLKSEDYVFLDPDRPDTVLQKSLT
jgi:hypothetical protein